MMKNCLISIISLFSLVSLVQNSKFFFHLPAMNRKCMGEYLTDNTVAIFSLISDNDINAHLFDPNGNEVYKKETSKSMKIAFTASEAGNHQLCITNSATRETKVDFEFLSGVNAKDYSDIAKKSNLKPIELNLQKLEDMISYLIHELSTIMAHEESTLALNDALSNKIILFSMITLVSMIVVGLVETIYIQRFLRNRKLI